MIGRCGGLGLASLALGFEMEDVTWLEEGCLEGA